MNPGVLSHIFLIIALILLLTGWRPVLMRGISTRSMYLFLFGWVTLTSFEWRIDHLTVINFGVILYLLLVLRIFWKAGSGDRIQLFSLGFLTGTVVFLLQELFRLDPVLIIADPYLDIAVVVVLIALIGFREVRYQIFLISFAVFLGEGLFLLFNTKRLPFYFGDWQTFDLWWMTVFTAVILRAVVSAVPLLAAKRPFLSKRNLKSR